MMVMKMATVGSVERVTPLCVRPHLLFLPDPERDLGQEIEEVRVLGNLIPFCRLIWVCQDKGEGSVVLAGAGVLGVRSTKSGNSSLGEIL
jgi:hypothetical protein